ncbi:MAG: hypothetical protein AB7O67_11460 [Vicinamibacterales bacterium]
MTDALAATLARARRRGAFLAVAGLLGTALGALFDPRAALVGWLVAFLFWLGLSLGCLGLLMVHLLSGGRWGLVVRRPLESGARMMPLLALAFVPLAIGAARLYPWAAPPALLDETLAHQHAYLNVPFFIIRGALYFAIWNWLTSAVTGRLRRQDDEWDEARASQARRLAAGGLIIYALTITLAGTDWVMSLEPHWFSTILGLLLMAGQGLLALALVIVVAAALRHEPALRPVLTPDRFHDLGKLLLAFVMLWAYMAFSQFLIIWAENLPEETSWYVQRATLFWQLWAAGLALFHFAVPFLVLLSRRVKRRIDPLVRLATALLVVRFLDFIWLVVPSGRVDTALACWLAVASLLAVGGAWTAGFTRALAAHPLLPRHDPELALLGDVTPQPTHP